MLVYYQTGVATSSCLQVLRTHKFLEGIIILESWPRNVNDSSWELGNLRWTRDLRIATNL